MSVLACVATLAIEGKSERRHRVFRSIYDHP